jgi:hypothetical protein
MSQKAGMQVDWAGIEATVQLYFDGLYHSDVEGLKKAFHPCAQVIGHFQGPFAVMSLDDFLGIVGGTPAPSESGEAYDMKIVLVDQVAEAALVKVEDLYMGLRFTDYLTLMKVDGTWRIINKAYRHE